VTEPGERDQPERGRHTTSTAMHIGIARQIQQDAERTLLDPLDLLLDPAGRTGATAELRTQLAADAEMWAAQVTGRDVELARATAMRVIAAIYQTGDTFTPPDTWWRTPFGSLVAQRFGHPSAAVVSLSVASAMLGITRQGAHDLVKRGKLQRDPEGSGVLVSSIQHRLVSH